MRSLMRISSVCVLSLALVLGAHRATVSAHVTHFVRTYRALKNTNAPINFWERLVYSLILSNTRATCGGPAPSEPAT